MNDAEGLHPIENDNSEGNEVERDYSSEDGGLEDDFEVDIAMRDEYDGDGSDEYKGDDKSKDRVSGGCGRKRDKGS